MQTSQYRAWGGWIGLCLVFLGAGRTVRGQEAERPQETYRLRVENTQYGRIEVSTDGGKTFALLGRVTTAARTATPDRSAVAAGSVLRSGPGGLVFAVAPGFVLTLRPMGSPKRADSEPFTLWTDLPKLPLFGEMLPPPQTPVGVQNGTHHFARFPEGYTPAEEDTFVFLVSLANQTTPEARKSVQERFTALAKSYAEGALSRAKANKRTLVSGTLSLRAKLPLNEPDPIVAVTYVVDGDVVAAQNTPPFVYAWDTRQATEGEHVVEIRALNSRGNIITRARTLVLVQNGNTTKN